MEFGECIDKRRSVRKFLDKQVSPDDLIDLIDAARKAPSSGNLQSWKFICVKNQNNKNEISDACFQQNWISQAPLLIVVVSQNDNLKRHYGVRGDVLYSIQDAALASQNILLKATELGLGSCFVSAFEEGMIKRILKIPDALRPQSIIAIGYSDDRPKKKILENIEAITYFESYGERVEDWDEAFYQWSGIMKKNVEAILNKIKKTSKSLKDKIKEKLEKRKNE